MAVLFKEKKDKSVLPVMLDELAEYEYNKTARSRHIAPEFELMGEALIDAFYIIETCKGDDRKKKLLDETVEWFMSDEQGRLFAFRCLCDNLNLDYQCVRRQVEKALDISKEERK